SSTRVTPSPRWRGSARRSVSWSACGTSSPADRTPGPRREEGRRSSDRRPSSGAGAAAARRDGRGGRRSGTDGRLDGVPSLDVPAEARVTGGDLERAGDADLRGEDRHLELDAAVRTGLPDRPRQHLADVN